VRVHFDLLPVRVRRPQGEDEPPLLLFEGSPHVALRSVHPEETTDATVEAICLSAGRVEIGCSVEVASTGEVFVCAEPLVLEIRP
jgi:hypothetical protein